jgi:hypothetical protein
LGNVPKGLQRRPVLGLKRLGAWWEAAIIANSHFAAAPQAANRRRRKGKDVRRLDLAERAAEVREDRLERQSAVELPVPIVERLGELRIDKEGAMFLGLPIVPRERS